MFCAINNYRMKKMVGQCIGFILLKRCYTTTHQTPWCLLMRIFLASSYVEINLNLSWYWVSSVGAGCRPVNCSLPLHVFPCVPGLEATWCVFFSLSIPGIGGQQRHAILLGGWTEGGKHLLLCTFCWLKETTRLSFISVGWVRKHILSTLAYDGDTELKTRTQREMSRLLQLNKQHQWISIKNLICWR